MNDTRSNIKKSIADGNTDYAINLLTRYFKYNIMKIICVFIIKREFILLEKSRKSKSLNLEDYLDELTKINEGILLFLEQKVHTRCKLIFGFIVLSLITILVYFLIPGDNNYAKKREN